MSDNIKMIFDIFLKIVRNKGYISDTYIYRDILNKFDEFISYPSKSSGDILKSSKFRRLRLFVEALHENLQESQFYNAMHDLLPVLYYAVPSGEVFKHLSSEFGLDLDYVIVLDDFGSKVTYDYFGYHRKNEYVSFDNPNFVDIVSILFEHTNLTDTFFTHFYQLAGDAEAEPSLDCFYYPEQFWYKFDDYLYNLREQYGEKFGQVLQYHFYHMAPILYAIKLIVTSSELNQFLKEECALVLCDMANLFDDFSLVIECIMTFLRKSKFIFPLRYRLMDFLLELQESGDRELQIKFVKKLFFLNKCHCCNLFHSIDDTILHVAYEKIENNYEILNMTKNYFVFHFLACRHCYEANIECNTCQSCNGPYGFHAMPFTIKEYENVLLNQFYTFGYDNESNVNIFLTNDNPTRTASEVHEERLQTIRDHVTGSFKEYVRELTSELGEFRKSRGQPDIQTSLEWSFLKPILTTFEKKSTKFFLSYIIMGCSEDSVERYTIDNTFVCPKISNDNIDFVSSMANTQKDREVNKRIAMLQNKLGKVIRLRLKLEEQAQDAPSFALGRERVGALESSIERNINRLEKMKPGIVRKIFGFYRPFFEAGQKKNKYVYQGITY
jgi:hypothetical protein